LKNEGGITEKDSLSSKKKFHEIKRPNLKEANPWKVARNARSLKIIAPLCT